MRNAQCDALRLTLVVLGHRVGGVAIVKGLFCRYFDLSILGKRRLNATEILANRPVKKFRGRLKAARCACRCKVALAPSSDAQLKVAGPAVKLGSRRRLRRR